MTSRQLMKLRKRPTHFLSIPLTKTLDIEPYLLATQSKLIKANIDGILEKDFIKSTKLHFTIGVMSLDGDSLPNARSALESIRPDIVEILSRQPHIYLNEFGCFPNSDQAQVLFCKPVDTTPLDEISQVLSYQLAIDVIRQQFINERLLTDTGPLTLHCTILKTSGTKSSKRPNFSFKSVQESLKNCDLGGPYPLERVEICEIGSTTPDGFYSSEGTISL
ncbi:hypothetical protein E3Q13_04284 [Wallemia mellicola]|nr:hypothetical protein E3Q13_04284 [Wallemia mellicola]TIC23194.1 hypothetical protein E3Q11_03939 [Wallemia mellicola]TIC72537.1 hypothetical protein E3Q00_03905 [Wallemia mellicola]